ncbi:LOW QUALITY PROTEIN: UDP-N-acetylglucosamine--dolichyl-phosphate N-acetylglucosaminephosphotransferase [Drosophila ficusphila]|uniref:LOW QUALITY PROTEIN: UDP-N-acetylglucosamine--dolichyl-phosphate N-acetylglucosaminephosphotransferase n=1 Tax=Drosophila ficusphila TaxID=30025 RepID=UPI0007E7423F|nr:LOW QUALITY PROTEIN: UDP-N-acetylglucosamine--dolichyl-phosphate N-acetylglucosaminephosphotransferase [Drosophila ficusphila]
MSAVAIAINAAISGAAYCMTVRMIPRFRDMFIKANLFGNDLCKKDKPQVPESFGVLIGCVFLVSLFVFIPIPFAFDEAAATDAITGGKPDTFPHDKFVELIAALLSICCMIFLGFADDVLDLRWRHKLLLPTIATLPLLMVYYVNYNSTTVIMPNFARDLVGTSLNIGVLYYVFMGMLAVFCTNAINILAGINGLEVGQSLIIAGSILLFNAIELSLGHQVDSHIFSIYFMLPFLATTLALWKFNKYPSQVFVGDTYCYFAGMTFAVVGILGHFSKTLLLFFLPQILNFLYSTPQLFHFVPCPRHRLPKYDGKTDLLHISTTEFRLEELNTPGRLMVTVLRKLRLISWHTKADGVVRTNNFTLINFVLVIFGPVHERVVTQMLMGFQVMCTLVALTIRYPLANYFYAKT